MTSVRKADVGDVSKLIPLVAAYWEFEEIHGFDAEAVGLQLQRLLADPRLGAGWVAFEEDKPIGYLLAVYVFSLEFMGITAEVDELFVLPTGRTNGAGSALLAAAESEFSKVGCTNISLQLSCENDAARRFYRRHGFSDRSKYQLLDKKLGNG